jgi:hypothetical protein
MIFHQTPAEELSAPTPEAETAEDWTEMAININGCEAGTAIPHGEQFGALVTYPNGRGVVLYDGGLRWGDIVESRIGVKILFLDDTGPDCKIRYVDESGGVFSNWLDAERKARRRRPLRSTKHSSFPVDQLPLKVFLSRILA